MERKLRTLISTTYTQLLPPLEWPHTRTMSTKGVKNTGNAIAAGDLIGFNAVYVDAKLG